MNDSIKQEYQDRVKQLTPKNNLFLNMLKAFFSGGIVCLIGQLIINYALSFGLDKEIASSWCSFILIFISALLTGLGLFSYIAKFAGAGVLVPITGFANGIASSALEFKSEGQVFGTGCRIFTIAGPVILYGLFTSWVLGFGYWIGKIIGWW